MPDAHEAAVKAMARALAQGDAPQEWDLDDARTALAALASSVAVREALVGAANKTLPWHSPPGLVPLAVDAILAALAPGEADEERAKRGCQSPPYPTTVVEIGTDAPPNPLGYRCSHRLMTVE